MDKQDTMDFKEGISVIVPSYKGEKWILKCLESLATQTLDKTLFETIVIINGEKDNTEALLDSFMDQHSKMNVRKIVLEEAGAANARNAGIENATRTYNTFIDDDDYVSSGYLESLYQQASEETIVIGQITDVDTDGNENMNNIVNDQIENARKKKYITYEDLLRPLRMNTLKLIPTTFIKSVSYDKTLENGEDVVFFTELLTKFSCRFKLTESNKAIYFRVLRNDSVSRQQTSFKFNILGRLAVIEKLNFLFYHTTEKEKHDFIKHSINAQMGFIKTYLKENPGEEPTVLKEIKKYNFLYFPYIELRLREKLKTLQHKFKEKNDLYHDTKERYNQVNKKYREATNQISTQKQQLATQKQQLATQKQQLTTAINKAQKAQAHFDQCRASSSYQLGHLILHEIRSIADMWRLPGKLNKIRHNKSKSELAS